MRVRGPKTPISPTHNKNDSPTHTDNDENLEEGESKKPGRSWSSAEWTMLAVCSLIFLVFIMIPKPERNYALVKRESEPHPYPLFSAEQMEDHSSKGTIKTIAWAVTISKDGGFVDGAAVLMRAVELTHPNPSLIEGTTNEVEFEHEFVAICHPEATKSRDALKLLGWKIIERIEPVTAEEIEGDFLRAHIIKSGCCGARELIKLYAWTLTSYWRVVHLDMDSLVLNNMDELFLMDASMIYTCDYNMMNGRSLEKLISGATDSIRACPVQGGFVVVRPNQRVFDEMVEIVKKGDFKAGGWGGTSIGGWWGGATFQGVVPYYYATAKASGMEVDGSAIEVDRCVYNNMVDKGLEHPLVGAPECRATPLQDIKNVHFTLCQKPWECSPAHQKNDVNHLCLDLHKRWHEIRDNLEQQGSTSVVKQSNRDDWSKGHCHGNKYTPIDFEALFSEKSDKLRVLSESIDQAPDLTVDSHAIVADTEETAVVKLSDQVGSVVENVLKSIAWAITVSKDGPFQDGAAVVMESILKTHPGTSNQFTHDFVAFVHPNATSSMEPLSALGYQVIVKKSPVAQSEIKTAFLRKHGVKSGCCGLDELIKLYAWTLTSYWRVVHLDMDSLVLNNMDELFLMDQSLIYTCDYNMMTGVKGGKKVCPVQGGFVVVRPDMKPFQEMVDIVKEGRFGAGAGRGKSGWNGTGIGHWWGGATFQGVVPYYYAAVADKELYTAKEVDRCIYDNMVDDPINDPKVGGKNCRATPLQDIKNVHFTLCQKPWNCGPARSPEDKQNLCISLHTKWHDLRRSAESRLGIPSVPIKGHEGKFHKGACKNGRYTPMAFSSK